MIIYHCDMRAIPESSSSTEMSGLQSGDACPLLHKRFPTGYYSQLAFDPTWKAQASQKRAILHSVAEKKLVLQSE